MTKKIKVAVVGIGNCFAGLIQGIEYYKQHPEREITGIMHNKMSNYSIYNIEFVAAFDISKKKVGQTLERAVYAEPNLVKWTKLPKSEVIVKPAPILDGVGLYVKDLIQPVNSRPIEQLREEILKEISNSGAKIILSYLPVGSQKATEFWAEIALESGCALINCIPVFIASNLEWRKKFKEKNLPLIGDDIKGQVGATIVHRTLAKLFTDRGVEVESTYQLNVGGNTDFMNMLERSRLESKEISKTNSVQSQLKQPLPKGQIHIGPSDYVEFLQNTKLAFIRLNGKQWGDRSMNLEIRLEVDDKSNSGGIVVDAIRAAQIALDRKIGGALNSASAYLMKSPPIQMRDEDAKDALNDFIEGKRND
ncbi:MAG: inositol-3-phosphate synthase [Candidatus Micrarchaeia archaeon]